MLGLLRAAGTPLSLPARSSLTAIKAAPRTPVLELLLLCLGQNFRQTLVYLGLKIS